ncbi:GNAT family N-acetyltransferase [Bacillus sp. SCS-153A]|uniref:GNAT family N-acetyltransferase n=1 Tax=Rossellomorea sedimentorum TaxID=3115294 RepID=UPI003906D1C7
MLLTGERIYLRPFEDNDAESLLRLVKRNKTFWGQTEPEWQAGYYTFEGQLQNIHYFREGFRRGQFYTLGIYDKGNQRLIGIVNLYDVKGGPFQSAMAGYSVDKKHIGKGIASESLQLLLSFAFQVLQLNRVAAEVLPRNGSSLRVLEKAGFQKEGFRRDNILIGGVWESHLQYALLKKEWTFRKRV